MIVKKWYTKYHNMSQTVDRTVEFSFLSQDNKQCFPFVFCKEFLLDAVRGQINNQEAKVYGFEYIPNTNPAVDLNECRVLLRNLHDKDFKDNIKNTVSFLQLLEDKMNCETKSKIDLVENTKLSGITIFCLTSPAKWMLSPPLLSLYTLMIRVGMNYTDGDTAWEHVQKVKDRKIKSYFYKDPEYLRTSWRTIMDVIESGGIMFHQEMAKNYPSISSSWRNHTFHDNAGIVSFAKGDARSICPDWYPKEEK